MRCLDRRVFRFVVLATIGLFLSVPSATALTPNDPLFSRQWYLRQIGVERAWDVTTGSSDVVVAVIDTGVDERHPDLRGAIWINKNEIFANNIDDDKNGYVDDVNGWNFVIDSPNTRPLRTRNQLDEALAHGTIVSSLIAGRGNDGYGMAGVAWNAKIMPIVVLGADGNGATQHITKAVRYATANGADIINMSLTGYEPDDELNRALYDAWKSGVFVAVAAGNDFRTMRGNDLEVQPLYPACSLPGSPAVITVSATDALDQKAPYANFGRTCVTLSAPGFELMAAHPLEIDGAAPESEFIYGITGTSAAVPLVSGAAALLKSLRPDWGPSQIRARLLETTEPIEDLQQKDVVGGLGRGRLDIGRAVQKTATKKPAPTFAKNISSAMVSLFSTFLSL